MLKKPLMPWLVPGGALVLLWLLLTGGTADSWVVGWAVVLAGTLISLSLGSFSFVPRLRWHALPRFLLLFLFDMLRGACQTAMIALQPRLHMKPGFITLNLSLPHSSSRILLVYVINLVPGTLSCELKGDTLKVHVLDVSVAVEEEVKRLEQRVAVLFGERGAEGW